MANTRFKGANSSERLTLATLSDSDMFQTRHLPGTVNDADKGVSKALLQALPVAICSTAAATAAKVGTLAAESCPDFALISGRAVQVYFSTANTASTPTLNLYGTGAIPIVYPDGSFVKTWGAGIWMILMYVSVTIDGTLTQRWVAMNLPADEVAADNMNSVTSNAVSNSLSYISDTEIKTGGRFFDGTNWKDVYKKTYYVTGATNGIQIPINISNLDKAVQFDGTMFMYDTSNRIYIYQLNNPNDSGYYTRVSIAFGNSINVLIGGFGTVNFIINLYYTKTTD